LKIIAFYLPQFHEIEENNRWWGKGFTEWTNLKKSKPLFKGHFQPRVPYKNNYYDLTNDQVKLWQVDIAKKHGIYGFCYYHYWFKGKLLLEKPMEQLLTNKEIDFPFCICWANEPWTRSWDGKYGEILIPQDYGTKKDWKDHFDYLVKFFKDDRYIKVDGKPMFLIYKSASIEKCYEMMDYWNELACENGFKGMYFVKVLRGRDIDDRELLFSAQVEFEPAYSLNTVSKLNLNFRRIYRYIVKTINKCFKTKLLLNIPYIIDKVYKKSLSHTQTGNIPTFPGAFVSWDNSPRRGNAATIFKGFNPKKFEQYLAKKIKKGKEDYKTEYLFINAWNEWCEGTYLEPDERYRYSYLEAVKNALEQQK
jgi:hypothetical protein